MSTPDKITPEEFRDAIVDYLYDEMDASTRGAFERTMQGSDELRREVDELTRTLRISRRALQVAAAETPPSRVRRNVLAAAAAAEESGEAATPGS